MKTTLSIILAIIGIVALMATPIEEQAANYATLTIISKIVMVVAFGLAILLNSDSNEEKDFSKNQNK